MRAERRNKNVLRRRRTGAAARFMHFLDCIYFIWITAVADRGLTQIVRKSSHMETLGSWERKSLVLWIEFQSFVAANDLFGISL